MVPGLDAAHDAGARRVASAGELRAGARGLAARLGHPRPSGGAWASARPRSNAPASSSWKASSGACCSSGSARRRSARRSRNCSRRSPWRPWRSARISRARPGQKAAAELQEVARGVSATRDREREQIASAQRACARAGSRRWVRRSRPRRCSRRRSARHPARSRNG